MRSSGNRTVLLLKSYIGKYFKLQIKTLQNTPTIDAPRKDVDKLEALS
jgi:hypothetical protein